LCEVFEQSGIGYVFAVGADFHITTSGSAKMRADQALSLVEARGWNRRSCGNGSKGRRLYDWAWIATASPRHHLLIRRKISDPTELAYYIAYVPDHYACSLTDQIKVAGTRWAIEDCGCQQIETPGSIWPGPTGAGATRPEPAGIITACASHSRHDDAYRATSSGFAMSVAARTDSCRLLSTPTATDT
jgi:hypothetical protein